MDAADGAVSTAGKLYSWVETEGSGFIMERKQILGELNAIFREAFMDDALNISEQTCAEDIEDWDSLMQITLITSIEKKYDVQFSLDDVLSLENVGGMVDLILRRSCGE